MKCALNILIILLLSTGAMAQNTAETDTRYKQAITMSEAKKEDQKKLTLPPDEEALDDFLPAQPVTPEKRNQPVLTFPLNR